MIDINKLGVPRKRSEATPTDIPPPIKDTPQKRGRPINTIPPPQSFTQQNPPPRPPNIYASRDETINRLNKRLIMLEGFVWVAFIFIAFLLGIWFGVVL